MTKIHFPRWVRLVLVVVPLVNLLVTVTPAFARQQGQPQAARRNRRNRFCRAQSSAGSRQGAFQNFRDSRRHVH